MQCDACHKVYDLNRQGVRCVYCGAYRCHPVADAEKQEENTDE